MCLTFHLSSSFSRTRTLSPQSRAQLCVMKSTVSIYIAREKSETFWTAEMIHEVLRQHEELEKSTCFARNHSEKSILVHCVASTQMLQWLSTFLCIYTSWDNLYLPGHFSTRVGVHLDASEAMDLNHERMQSEAPGAILQPWPQHRKLTVTFQTTTQSLLGVV